MNEQKLPPGWDSVRVDALIRHYDNLNDDELLAEDEEATENNNGHTTVTIPSNLLPAVRQLLAAQKL